MGLDAAAWICVVSMLLGNSYADLTCLSCPQGPLTRECRHVETCAQDQTCFMDMIQTSNGTLDAVFGCRQNYNCTNTNMVGKRQQQHQQRRGGDLLLCTHCCDTDLCNQESCGHKEFITNSGPVCFACDHEPTDQSCQQIRQCAANEVCDAEQRVISSIIGRRRSSSEISTNGSCVSKCCDSNLCNKGPCVSMTHSTTDTNNCLTNPCVHGTCSNTFDGYTCTCTHVYTGTNCDRVVDNCLRNPCVFGTCFNEVGAYRCTCDRGYTGGNCDKVFDQCYTNPCLNGRCSYTVGGYSCSCFHGYTGTNCERVADPCSPNPCTHDGVCSQSASGYKCSCHGGYAGQRCELYIG